MIRRAKEIVSLPHRTEMTPANDGSHPLDKEWQFVNVVYNSETFISRRHMLFVFSIQLLSLFYTIKVNDESQSFNFITRTLQFFAQEDSL